MDQAKIGTIKVLEKVGAVLEVLREQERVTPVELVERIGESRTTVVRICETLTSMRLLEREPSDRVSYRLGLGLLELGTLVGQRLGLRQVALPVLEELAESLGDSTNLVVPQADSAVCLIRIEGSYPVVARALREGGHLPYDVGGASQAVFAFADDDLQRRALQNMASARRKVMLQRIPTIRAKGYVISRGEFLPETGAIGAPIFGATGAVVAGVSVSGVLSRISDARIELLIAEVLQSGESISRSLGYNGSYPPRPDAKPDSDQAGERDQNSRPHAARSS